MNYCFAADRTLGKLAKWLRILGFDTIFESDVSGQGFYEHLEPERVLLTRIAKIRNRYAAVRRLVFVEADDVNEQLKHIIDGLVITRQDIRLFSICLRCNSPVIKVTKQAIYGLVPDYIWEFHDEFHSCRRCERIFWAGSHKDRCVEVIHRLFKMQNES